MKVEWTSRTDPSCLLTASGQRALRLYDLRSPNQTAVRSVSSAHVAAVTSISISPHRPNLVASCSARGGVVKIWDFRKWGASADSTYSEPLCTIILPSYRRSTSTSTSTSVGGSSDSLGAGFGGGGGGAGGASSAAAATGDHNWHRGVTVEWSPSNADVIATAASDEPYACFWDVRGSGSGSSGYVRNAGAGTGEGAVGGAFGRKDLGAVSRWTRHRRGTAAAARGSVAALSSANDAPVRVIRTPTMRRWLGSSSSTSSNATVGNSNGNGDGSTATTNVNSNSNSNSRNSSSFTSRGRPGGMRSKHLVDLGKRRRTHVVPLASFYSTESLRSTEGRTTASKARRRKQILAQQTLFLSFPRQALAFAAIDALDALIADTSATASQNASAPATTAANAVPLSSCAHSPAAEATSSSSPTMIVRDRQALLVKNGWFPAEAETPPHWCVRICWLS